MRYEHRVKVYLLSDVTQKRPHPKSLSLRAKGNSSGKSLALREKAARLSRVGDEGFA